MKLKNIIPTIVFMTSYLIKVHKIEKGNFVIWDEAHFGLFSQSYLNRSFYFDVHPPLGKMLTALSGYIYGQSEEFSFKSSDNFPNNFDYVGMRRFHAELASFVPLFAYLIFREFKISLKKSAILSTLFIFDNGMTSISRLILLDSHLLAFTAATAYAFVKYYFSRKTIDLAALGIALGCVLSVKWIGCLTMLYVGLFIIYTLFWDLISKKLFSTCRNFCKFAIFLILIPGILYILFFLIHFQICNKSSTDAGSFSLDFNMSLKNNSYNDIWKYISFGKPITLKLNDGYLHSHKHEYPNSKLNNQYQITLYPHKDTNNTFYFQKVNSLKGGPFLNSNDEIVILHSETMGYLTTSNEKSTISDGLVVHGSKGSLFTESVWIIETEENLETPICSLFTKFYLKNKSNGLYLAKSGNKYPNWGFNQGEIILTSEKNDKCEFFIEDNLLSEQEGNLKHGELKSNFFKRLIELNIKMYKTNKSFLQDPDLEPNRIDSKPWEWFILTRGLRMSQWKENHKFYMFFNPLLFYMSSISIIYTIFKFISDFIKFEAFVVLEEKTIKSNFLEKNKNKIYTKRFINYICLGGWMIHYLPFFIVGRVLYLHHYFPAYFFALLSLCVNISKLKNNILIYLSLSVTITFCLYSSLTYGFLDLEKVKYLKLIPSWDFID